MIAVFRDVWDWTAVGTIALAATTLVSVVLGWRSLRQAQKQIMLGQQQLEQTQREIELSRQEVEEAHRPLLVPFVDSARALRVASGHDVPARPTVPRPGLLVIAVKNIGPGPALRLEAFIESPEHLPSGPLATGIVATAVGVAEMMPLEVELSSIGEVPTFTVRLVYEDVAGKRWLTFGRWAAAHNRYEELEIRLVAVDGIPIQGS